MCASRLVSNFSSTKREAGWTNETWVNGKGARCEFYDVFTDVFRLTSKHCNRRSSELIAIVVSALFSMPGGCLLFIPLYHPLHDFLGVPSEVTSVTILIAFTSIVWKFDRKSNRYSEPPK